ncbi:hypothetical protein [uncultured Meiothermus sp.]|jgi:hypothetical protein|uniref:hypothetical protein n=1 Tax=uncultured Meiothermus sp. TaxID=157471 RepID=UPI002605DB29|nr:hypothetical protein [uncultured Meiothermus sp.]
MKSARFAARGLAVLLALLILQPGLAQELQTRFELRFSTALTLSSLPPGASWGLGAYLEARYHLSPVSLHLVLEPGANFSSAVTTDAGLTELYALYRADELDVSLGLERLPLEVARLSLPYSLEPLSPLGSRQGRWGARLSWNPEAARVRLAVVEDAGRVLPVLSLRREFEGFELEAHALYRSNPVFGLGGSGTLAGLVVYGETWLLPATDRLRYVLGLSGSLGEGFWTLEGGHAPALPPFLPGHFLAGQWLFRATEEASWNLGAHLLLEDPLRAQLSTSYIQASDNHELTSSLAVQFGPQPLVLIIRLSLRAFM